MESCLPLAYIELELRMPTPQTDNHGRDDWGVRNAAWHSLFHVAPQLDLPVEFPFETLVTIARHYSPAAATLLFPLHDS